MLTLLNIILKSKSKERRNKNLINTLIFYRKIKLFYIFNKLNVF